MGPLTGTVDRPLRRDLHCVTWDGVTYSFMVGVGETYVAAMVLALGLGEVVAGLITTLPIFVGSLLQLATPRGVRLLGSNRRWVLLCAATQSLSLIPLGVAAVLGTIPAWGIFLAVTLYWACNLGAGPAWNTWVTTIIPRRIRATYFGRRTRLCQLGTLVGIVVGGAILALAERADLLPAAFVALFALASASRALSTLFLAGQSEPQPLPEGHRLVTPREMIRRLRHGPDMRLLSYMLAVQVAVQISAAFFNPYMLRELEFSKGEYAAIVAATFLAKSLAAPLIGLLARRHGARCMLRVGGVAIVPLAAAWMATSQFHVLLAVQVFAGVAWAAYELGTFLLMLETIPEEERTSVLTLFNLGNASAIAGGSLVGGALLGLFGQDASGYMIIFGLSTVLRLGSLVLLLRVHADAATPVPIAVGPMAVRPNLGSMDRPVIGSIETVGSREEADSSEGDFGDGAQRRSAAARAPREERRR
ncbi:MAG TPA: MFS transporter [Phycisphaerales bacterium]|nr:MFS transporter [Phycisphaerales bacterium]HMP36258.1 MFS transporter [Phycisphaerales bacterium]